MSKVTVTESYLEDIGDAIREKLNTIQGYTPGQMAAAIESIPTGGITPTGTINIIQNGTADVTQYASAAVNVPNSYAAGDEGKVVQNGALVAQTSRTVTENGTYDTTENDEVVVNVPSSQPNLQSKTATQNGTITPDSGYDGLSSVVVNVSGGGGESDVLVPEYQGLAYSYIAVNGQYYQDNEDKKNFSLYFHVVPNHTYALFIGDTVSDRLRAHFYAGKNYSDFEYYVNNSLAKQVVFTSTYNISGTDDLSGEGLMRRLIYTPTAEGEIVVFTSRSSVTAVAYCVKLT